MLFVYTVYHMPKNGPDTESSRRVHREVKARAARTGMDLSGYLLCEAERIASLPPVEEALARIAALPETGLSESPAEAVRAIREGAG